MSILLFVPVLHNIELPDSIFLSNKLFNVWALQYVWSVEAERIAANMSNFILAYRVLQYLNNMKQ